MSTVSAEAFPEEHVGAEVDDACGEHLLLHCPGSGLDCSGVGEKFRVAGSDGLHSDCSLLTVGTAVGNCNAGFLHDF